jgi:DNA-binding PadR family transcriptional regulator
MATKSDMATQRATLKHAVLGLVLERPSYGYELGTRLNERFPFWRTTGVYGSLDRLSAEDLVVVGGGAAVSERSVARAVYRGTAAGREVFHEWLCASTEFTVYRQDLDLKLGLSGPAEWPSLIKQISSQEAFCVAALKELTGNLDDPTTVRPGWLEISAGLQRDAEIKMLQVRIEWLQDVRTALRLMLERRPKAI